MPRPRKGPHLYRRSGRPGLWGYVDRDHKDIPLGTEDEGEALLRLAEHVARVAAEAAAGGSGGPAALPRGAAGPGAISKIFKECEKRADVEGTPKTAYELKLNLRRIAAWLLEQGNASADRVTAQVVADYREWRRTTPGVRTKRPASAARVNREIDAWCRAWKIAVEWKVAATESLEFFTHLREAEAAPHERALTTKELRRFFTKTTDLNLRAFFRATLGTAMRDEEMRHLRREWLGKDAVTVSPQEPGTCECHPDGWKTKGFRYRTIPVTPATRSALEELLAAQEAGWAIPCERWVWEQIQRAAAAAKLDPFSLHDLRHAGASHWLHDGVPIATISKWLGHKDIQTTQRYLHVVEDDSASRRKLRW